MTTKNTGGVDVVPSGLNDYSAPLNKSINDLTGLARDYRDVSVAGAVGNYTLSLDDSTPEGRSPIVRFTGVLTGNRTVLWPATGGTRWAVFVNDTTGAFTLTLKTDQGSSTGVAIPQGYGLLCYHNGTHVYGVGEAFAPQTGVTAGAWTSYTPTISAGSGSFTSVSATIRYRIVGKACYIAGTVTITTNGTAAGYIRLTVPFTPIAAQAGAGRIQETSQTVTLGINTEPAAYLHLYDGTYPGATGRHIDFNAVILLA